MANNTRHLQAYHAVPGMGAVLHTLNIRLSPTELSFIIAHAGATGRSRPRRLAAASPRVQGRTPRARPSTAADA